MTNPSQAVSVLSGTDAAWRFSAIPTRCPDTDFHLSQTFFPRLKPQEKGTPNDEMPPRFFESASLKQNIGEERFENVCISQQATVWGTKKTVGRKPEEEKRILKKTGNHVLNNLPEIAEFQKQSHRLSPESQYEKRNEKLLSFSFALRPS